MRGTARLAAFATAPTAATGHGSARNSARIRSIVAGSK